MRSRRAHPLSVLKVLGQIQIDCQGQDRTRASFAADSSQSPTCSASLLVFLLFPALPCRPSCHPRIHTTGKQRLCRLLDLLLLLSMIPSFS